MKKSIKTLMPIPNGHVVLYKETTGDTAWISQEENGYEFRLAEYTDGTTALYRVNTDGSIDLDNDSVLVRKIFCLHCGEQLNPDLEASTGRPAPFNYHCTSCGRNIEIGKEDE